MKKKNLEYILKSPKVEAFQNKTHYCPGCGHGILHKLLGDAMDELGIKDITIFIDSVGCSVFAYNYFDCDHIQVPHGRAPAVATAVKRLRPDKIVITYQGDGDLAAIGTAEIIHAANRGENITIIFVNNAIYGMTGGQLAPTTLIKQKSTTTPRGRFATEFGYPLKICEMLNTLKAPAYLERVALYDPLHIKKAKEAVKKALRMQIKGKGFSLVEVLSHCPTNWKMTPEESMKFVKEKMEKYYPLKIFRDREFKK